MNLLPQKGMQLELGLPVHRASNADYGVCTAQSIDRDHEVHHVPKPQRKGADNASFVIRGRRRMNGARLVFRYAKAHWLPPVNRALAWSEGVLTVDVYAVAHCNRRVDVSASCDGRRLHIRGGSISTESAAFAFQFDVRFAQKVPAFAFGGSRLSGFGCKGFGLQERR